MKYIFLIVSLFFPVSAIFAQNSPCPNITVTGPNELVSIGESMTFTANISGIDSSKLKYEWTISNGEISSGQGTNSITVATTEDMAGQTVTATIDIKGLPENCNNSVSVAGEIKARIICDPRKFDEYENLSWKEERERLDNLALELKIDSNAMAYFIVTVKKDYKLQKFTAIQTKFEKYLTQKHKIPKSQFRFSSGGTFNSKVLIYIVPIIYSCP